MSDFRAAQLTLGGCISRALVPGLCAAIRDQHAALEWGEASFEPQCVEDLLAARRQVDGELVLVLYDDRARYGAFEHLEPFLTKRRIPFDRRSEASFDDGETLLTYRPESLNELFPMHGGEIVTPTIPLWDFADVLHAFRKQVYRGPRHLMRERCEELVRQFHDILPPRPVPLPAFEIGRSVGLRRAA